ncbi:DMT family transporter [Agrococcus sp. HG114]|uniref:DMT family transporter n=1 Tax=Agrococcus sp. HG114 TaxID=2969757 RepID=UPI00215A2F34|nr:DMT family transporter [Agrococcus sp. HG114]MCR8671424.1 multidrug DMT transporter permease [Agrococcus sp. HG114]
MLFTALDDIAAEISLTPMQALGIPVAIVGAVFLSVGTQFQHRGVDQFEGGDQRGAHLGGSAVLGLLRKPAWVLGTLLLGLAVVLQIGALALAPLIVVQPLGAVALVVTAILNARLARIKLDHRTIRAIGLCLVGIGIFVGVAAIFAVERPISDRQLLTVLALLVVALAGVGVLWWFYRHKANAIFYIVTAGVLYGFVVTLSKIVINRIISGQFEWLTVVCAVALVVALIAGSYAVQLAHASGPPDLVIAGLTVVDPLVAVLIGVAVLGEAAATPPWAILVFAAAGALAVTGVLQLARHHPQIRPLAEAPEETP